MIASRAFLIVSVLSSACAGSGDRLTEKFEASRKEITSLMEIHQQSINIELSAIEKNIDKHINPPGSSALEQANRLVDYLSYERMFLEIKLRRIKDALTEAKDLACRITFTMEDGMTLDKEINEEGCDE